MRKLKQCLANAKGKTVNRGDYSCGATDPSGARCRNHPKAPFVYTFPQFSSFGRQLYVYKVDGSTRELCAKCAVKENPEELIRRTRSQYNPYHCSECDDFIQS